MSLGDLPSGSTADPITGAPAAPLSYRDALQLLYRRGHSIRPGLERIRALADLLDHPERNAPAVQVAGTNGKSTTAWMVGSILAAHGLTAGIYTSPHVQSLRERYRLVGPALGPASEPEEPGAVAADPISPAELSALVEYLLPFVDLVDRGPAGADGPVSYFELATAMAFEWMSNRAVGVGVFETGLGGSWDATNVVPGEVAVLTHVAVDHIALLGRTPLDNAREKVGIIKRGARVVSAGQDPDVAELLAQTAAGLEAEVVILGRDLLLLRDEPAVRGRLVTVDGPLGGRYEDVFVPLLGAHQSANAALAIGAAEQLLGRGLDPAAVAAGMAAVTSPGRLEVVGHEPLVVLDGAHNPDAAATLGPALDEAFGARRRILVASIFADKDLEGILKALLPGAAHTIFTRNANPRAAAPAQLAEIAAGLGAESVLIEDLAAAIDAAREDAGPEGLVVISGSLATVGEARTLLVGPVE